MLADRYELAERVLAAAGLAWYEISNWAPPRPRCRHNLGYWRGGDWWGVGPGAHSHVGGVRWWNVLHPARTRAARRGPFARRRPRVLDADDGRLERVMLGLRLRTACRCELMPPGAPPPGDVAEGLLDRPITRGRAVLTLRGRLLADAVTIDLVD